MFGDIPTFLSSDGLPHVTSSKLLEILNDSVKSRKLKMELAITIDSMEPFAKATYALEGDGALALVTYERVSMLYSVISTEHYPNVNAMAKQLTTGDAACEQQLVRYAKACVQPAYQYFQSKFDNDLKPALLAFKAARYFSPSKVSELKPSSADIDWLCKFTFLNSSSVIDGLKTELPQYLASAKLCLTKSMLFNGGRLMSLNSPVGQEHSSLYCLCNHLQHLKEFSLY